MKHRLIKQNSKVVLKRKKKKSFVMKYMNWHMRSKVFIINASFTLPDTQTQGKGHNPMQHNSDNSSLSDKPHQSKSRFAKGTPNEPRNLSAASPNCTLY